MKTKQDRAATTTTADTTFEQQVLNFCETAAEPIVTLFKQEYEYGDAVGKTLGTLLDSFSSMGFGITIVQKPNTIVKEERYEYQYTAFILKFTTIGSQEVYIKINCNLSSYDGLEYLNHKQVTPVTKTVQVFE